MDFNQPKSNKRKARTGKKNEAPPTAPVFLRKTFEMINTCDPSVATWSDDGLTFVVKDTKTFSSDFIPNFFKHNNFSSFVRQLNFYGFHKVKADPLRIDEAENSEESKYWKFHHNKFRRGRPDLLSEIKKSNKVETADKQDVDDLKKEVGTLRDQVSSISRELEGLKALVGTMLQQGQHQQQQQLLSTDETPPKKRRLSIEPPSAVTSGLAETKHVPLPTLSLGDLEDVASDASIGKFALPEPLKATGARDQSIGINSFTSQDEAMLSSLFAIDPLDEVSVLETDRPVAPRSSTPPDLA